jgi:hypothetical protein
MSYPEEIIVIKDSPEYEALSRSEVFRTLAESWSKTNEVILTSEYFGDKWPMFVDLFFPEMGQGPLFIFRNRSIQVNPKRGTKKDLDELLDFLLVDKNFARNQARKQLNAPANTANRGKGTRRNWTNERKRGNSNYNNYNNENNNVNNNNNNNKNGPNIGFANNNEEAILGKLSNKNAKKYFPNIGRRSKTRRIKN